MPPTSHEGQVRSAQEHASAQSVIILIALYRAPGWRLRGHTLWAVFRSGYPRSTPPVIMGRK
jgi:hypothetical protein